MVDTSRVCLTKIWLIIMVPVKFAFATKVGYSNNMDVWCGYPDYKFFSSLVLKSHLYDSWLSQGPQRNHKNRCDGKTKKKWQNTKHWPSKPWSIHVTGQKKLFWSSWVAFLGDINRHDMSVPTCQRRLVVDVNAMKPLLRGVAKCWAAYSCCKPEKKTVFSLPVSQDPIEDIVICPSWKDM